MKFRREPFAPGLTPRRLAAVALGSAIALWLGLAHAQSTASAFTTGFRYDAGRRLVGTIKPDPDGSGPIHFGAVRNTFDAHGLLIRVETGELSAWQDETKQPSAWTGFTVFQQVDYTYDNWGHKLTEKGSSGGTAYTLTQYSYDTMGRLQCVAQRMNPAAYGNLPSSACALGTEGTQGPDRIAYTDLDVMGRPKSITKAYGTPLAYQYASYSYLTNGILNGAVDSAGNQYTFYNPGQEHTVTDANGNESDYEYDTLGRLKRWYFPSPATKNTYNPADYEEYTYDDGGDRKTLRKRDGETISYDYDALSRVVDEVYPAGTIKNVYYTYDLRNLQLSATFDSSTGTGLSMTYDGFGHLATASTNQSGSARTLSYQYDAEGNRTRLTFPDSAYFTYAYDGLNRLATIKENGSALLITETYDSAGRRHTLQRGASVSSTTYGYDPISRLQTLSQDLQGTAYDETRTFGYNPASQVTSRALSNGTYAFNEVPAVTTEYGVNGLNQYTSLSSSTSVTPKYDANGNMTFDGSSNFGYDVLNRMISRTVPATGATIVNLSYDPKGRLFQTSGGTSVTTQFLYDGDALVAEYNAAGVLQRRYVHGAGVDEPLVTYEGATVGASNRRYYHADHQGSVIAVTDTNGNGIQLNRYDPYGAPATGNGMRFQYTGQIWLPELGQYYYKARIYNPTLGRFMQIDPIGYQSDVDLYSYVASDPFNLRDSTGETPESELYVAADIAMGLTGVSSPGEAVFNAMVDFALGFSPVPGSSTAFHSMEGVIKVRDGVKVVERIAEGGAKARRAGKEFTEAQSAAAKAENAAKHGGEMHCEDCDKALIPSPKSEKGVPTPDNAAQIHHEPPIHQGGGRDSVPVVLCPICHKIRHLFGRGE